jgi:DNA-binding IclR family transcriptional regulator
VARQEMRRLADELDLVVAAMFVERDEIVVRERAASGRHLRWLPSAGARYPIRPWSAVFMTLGSPSQLESSLNRMKPPLSEAEREALRAQFVFSQSHGYLVATSRSAHLDIDREGLSGLSAQFGGIVVDLRPKQSFNVLMVQAPVLNEEGGVAFALSIYGFSRPYTGEEVVRIGEQLREACGRIGSFLSGGRS